MSYMDDLKRFDREWNEHTQWRAGKVRNWIDRNGSCGEASREPPGKYVVERAQLVSVHCGIALPEMPESVRRAVLEKLNGEIGNLVNACYRAQRAELLRRAKQEAKRVLAEIEPEEEPAP